MAGKNWQNSSQGSLTLHTQVKTLAKIGVFDSGIGGLSILNEALRQFPGHHYVYLADSANIPYGEKSSQWVARRSLEMCNWLIETQRCEAVVVACNTATAQAIAAIREHHPSIPVIGVEPGLKPAAAISARKKIGVLATQSTLSSEKFHLLLESIVGDCEVIVQAGIGLVPLIESGNLQNPELEQLITTYVQKMIDAGADTLVLGCTHYPFLAPLIEKKFKNQIQIIDTGQAIIRQLGRKTLITPLSNSTKIDLYTSGDPKVLSQQTRNLLQCYDDTMEIHAYTFQ